MSGYLNKPVYTSLSQTMRSRRPIASQPSEYIDPQLSRTLQRQSSSSINSRSTTSTGTIPSDVPEPSSRAQDHITRTQSILRRIRKATAEIGHTMRLLRDLYRQCLHEHPNLSRDSIDRYVWPQFLTASREFRESGCVERASMLCLMYESGLDGRHMSGGCDEFGSPVAEGFRVSTFWVTNRAGEQTPVSTAGFTPQVLPHSGRSVLSVPSEQLSVLEEQYEQEVADVGFHPLTCELPARIDAAEIVGVPTKPTTPVSGSSHADTRIDTAQASPLPMSLRPGTLALAPDYRAEQTIRALPTRKPVPSQRTSPTLSPRPLKRAPSNSSQRSALPLSLRPGMLIAPTDDKAQRVTTTVPSRTPVSVRTRKVSSSRAPQHPPIPYSEPFNPYAGFSRMADERQSCANFSRRTPKTPAVLGRPMTPDFDASRGVGRTRASGVFSDPLCIDDEVRTPYLDEICLTPPPSSPVGFFDGASAVDLRMVLDAGASSRRQRPLRMSYF